MWAAPSPFGVVSSTAKNPPVTSSQTHSLELLRFSQVNERTDCRMRLGVSFKTSKCHLRTTGPWQIQLVCTLFSLAEPRDSILTQREKSLSFRKTRLLAGNETRWLVPTLEPTRQNEK